MSLVALGSVRSCSVTTMMTALAAVWPGDRRRLVVELDPAGGTLGARFGLKPEPGLMSLAAAARRRDDPEVIWEHCQHITDDTEVLVAPTLAEAAVTAFRLLGTLPAQLGRLDADVFVDCGRLTGASIARDAFERAELSLLVVRPQLPDLHCLGAWLERNAGGRGALALVLVGAGHYHKLEVEDALHVEVLGDVPFDADGASALTSVSASRVRGRSPLVRHARSIADAIREKFTSSEPVTPSESPDHEKPSRVTLAAAVGMVEREESLS